MQDYAIIGKLQFEDIPNAINLKLGYYGGMPFAVPKTYTEDKLYLIFLPDGQISEEYAKEHDLIRRRDPETGERAGGFFEENRKVATIKLMQGKITSVGYVADIETLAFTGYDLSSLEDGMSFNSLNDVPICTKFVTKHTRQARSSQNRKMLNHREERGLKMHPDTSMYYRSKGQINTNDLITITLKLDGTSFRAGVAYENQQPKRWKLWLLKILRQAPKENRQLKFLAATRRVILDRSVGEGYYKDNSIYLEVASKLEGQLSPGEAIYGEIVGWKNENQPLFLRGGMAFKYGCLPGERDFYVYNITWTLPDGKIINLPWSAIKQRCDELNLKTVPTLVDTFVFNGDIEMLDKIVEHLTEGPDPIDSSHIREGIVLRIESGLKTVFLKSKGAEFYALEHKAKSDENFVDLEEIQDI